VTQWKNCYYLFFVLLWIHNAKSHPANLSFHQVIIWGHKLHTHTHSYVHEAFYRSFRYLGYDTYWFSDEDDVSQFDFSRSLFITEGQVDKKIPIRSDCYYILHNCVAEKYQNLFDNGRCIFLQVYTNDCITSCSDIIKRDAFIYSSLKGRIIFMPWATDLLPNEIEHIQSSLHTIKRRNHVYFIGTIGTSIFGNVEQVAPFKNACKEQNIDFIQKNHVDRDQHIHYIQISYMAPTIVGTYQQKVGYIPCRIFKNVSYGQYPITNSKEVYDLFGGYAVFNTDTYQLFYDAKKRLETVSKEEIIELMDFVKRKHTYLNRIDVLLTFLSEVQREYAI
jgi:hypothetical protein